ncbi:hypothetical protein H4R26_003987 [Coemansia thaxteri]|uniref:PQ-loop-domain-containing protein n=1 Tax=Coemansia thaxteri TaxID=2663907 RepID=A0A9W8BDK2_9FUNG|nr:hypothetical protein H4R26_003987 [Coemansia thaxteri]KAJ2484368.1 hypothetical protein EV174_002488 [Coemansia sp. RSA 2320]
MQTLNDTAASNAIGYISLLSWMVVMFPQIYLNYRRKSGEGVSLTMMVAWVIGDVFNITGALMQDLVMSTLLIGFYFLLVDSTLLTQTIYYRTTCQLHLPVKDIVDDDNSEHHTAALLVEDDNSEERLPAVPTSATVLIDHSEDAGTPPLQQLLQQRQQNSPGHLAGVLALLLSLASLGCLAVMVVALLAGAPQPEPPSGGDTGHQAPPPLTQIVAQTMGTASAIIYIMSYVPQAIQNYQRKSCEGLSMWLFLLSMLGNTTYAMAILVVSLNPHHLAPYVPWLLGALVPCIIQIVILYQFQIYRH